MGAFTPSEGEGLYLNFLSYADLFLDCCVSLNLRREAFFLITHEEVYILFENSVCVHKKGITHF